MKSLNSSNSTSTPKFTKSPILKEWINDQHLQVSSVRQQQKEFLSSRPFPHIKIPFFLHEAKALALQNAISKVQYELKVADLFQFYQTSDLTTIDHSENSKIISQFIALLRHPDFRTYFKAITNQDIKRSKIDLFASIYRDTHFLLPHDDQLEGRQIAFMLYLTTLQQKDGGILQLFESKNKIPTQKTKDIIPEFNSFIFFKVSPISFHQVTEVLRPINRLTLSGWYSTHGKSHY